MEKGYVVSCVAVWYICIRISVVTEEPCEFEHEY
jgi:hypothetical protein